MYLIILYAVINKIFILDIAIYIFSINSLLCSFFHTVPFGYKFGAECKWFMAQEI